jgi:hypothetical protein
MTPFELKLKSLFLQQQKNLEMIFFKPLTIFRQGLPEALFSSRSDVELKVATLLPLSAELDAPKSSPMLLNPSFVKVCTFFVARLDAEFSVCIFSPVGETGLSVV